MNNQKINSMSYENRVKQLTNGILLASGLYDKNFNLITNKITRASINQYKNHISYVIFPQKCKRGVLTNMFLFCSSLIGVVFPDGTEFIEESAFESCSSLTDIIIPEGVTVISYQAFRNCNSLKQISLPNSLKCIYMDAFSYCDDLTTIEIPDNVSYLGSNVFSGC